MNYNFNQSPIQIDTGLNGYMSSVFSKMFMALCLTGGVSYVCSTNAQVLRVLSGGVSTLLMLVTLGIVFYLSSCIHKISVERASAFFWIYATLIGLSFSPLFAVFTGESLATTFFTTSIFFGSMSLYGYVTKRDLTGLGSFMTVGLFSVVIATIINIFLRNSFLQMGLSAITIVVFCGLTAYDIQRIRDLYVRADNSETASKCAILGALSLYLDFINIFLALLRFVGNRK